MNNDYPDPLRVIHEEDTVRIIEPTGKTSVTIHTAIKEDTRPFKVQFFRSTQEIKDSTGKTVARTTDPEMAEHICKLLIAHTLIEARKAAAVAQKGTQP